MKKKQFTACLLVVILLFTVPLPAFSSEAVPESPSAELFSDMNREEIEGYLEKIYDVISNEEFQTIMQYPEVEALAWEILRTGAEFVYNEPELTEKILLTAGVEEKYLALLKELLQDTNPEEVKEAIVDFKESEKGKEILSLVNEHFDKEQLLSLIEKALELMLDDR